MKNLQGSGSATACEDSREPKLCREASRGLGNGQHDSDDGDDDYHDSDDGDDDYHDFDD